MNNVIQNLFSRIVCGQDHIHTHCYGKGVGGVCYARLTLVFLVFLKFSCDSFHALSFVLMKYSSSSLIFLVVGLVNENTIANTSDINFDSYVNIFDLLILADYLQDM